MNELPCVVIHLRLYYLFLPRFLLHNPYNTSKDCIWSEAVRRSEIPDTIFIVRLMAHKLLKSPIFIFPHQLLFPSLLVFVLYHYVLSYALNPSSLHLKLCHPMKTEIAANGWRIKGVAIGNLGKSLTSLLSAVVRVR